MKIDIFAPKDCGIVKDGRVAKIVLQAVNKKEEVLLSKISVIACMFSGEVDDANT